MDAPTADAGTGGSRAEAFRTMVEPEIPVMLRVARSLTGGAADTEDAVQEVQAHLEICGKCQGLAADFTALHSSPGRLGAGLAPDPDVIDRVHGFLDSLQEQESTDPGPGRDQSDRG